MAYFRKNESAKKFEIFMKKRLKWQVSQCLYLPQTSDKIQKNSFYITETIYVLETVSRGQCFEEGPFTCPKSTIETLEKCEICSKLTIKTPEQRY